MIATSPTQEHIDQIARDLAPGVVRIRFNEGEDWSGHPALYFRVVLSDEASRTDHLSVTAAAVRGRLFDELNLAHSDHIPYVRFRSQSEQAELKDAAWD